MYYFFVFRTVQEQGIHLRRLIYLTEEEFKLLELLKKRFLKRIGRFSKGSYSKAFPRKAFLKSPERKDLRQDNYIIPFLYEPTNIDYTRESLYWSWRRVKEYYENIFQEEGMNIKIQQARRLMYS